MDLGHTYGGSGDEHQELSLPLESGDEWTEKVDPSANIYIDTATLITIHRPRKFVFQQHNEVGMKGDGTGGSQGFATISYTFEPDVGHGMTLYTSNLTRELPRDVGIPDDLLTVCCRPGGVDRYRAAIEKALNKDFCDVLSLVGSDELEGRCSRSCGPRLNAHVLTGGVKSKLSQPDAHIVTKRRSL